MNEVRRRSATGTPVRADVRAREPAMAADQRDGAAVTERGRRSSLLDHVTPPEMHDGPQHVGVGGPWADSQERRCATASPSSTPTSPAAACVVRTAWTVGGIDELSPDWRPR